MLKLNIWTPSLTGKRPVMFYMNGGGFSFGSSYNGDEKATAVIAALKKAYPQKKIQTLSYMCAGSFLNGLGMRNNVVKMARLKHELKSGPSVHLLLHLANFSMVCQAHGTLRNFNSASTTPSAANKERATHSRRKRSRKTWLPHGRRSPQPGTRVCRA